MVRKISKYTIAIVISLFFLLLADTAVAQSQSRTMAERLEIQKRQEQIEKNKRKKKKEEDRLKRKAEDNIPVFYGAYVGIDIIGPGAYVVGNDFLSSEINLTVNLKNRFLPTVEVGYGQTDSWNDKGLHYKGSSPYFRVGMDYNTMAKKKNKNSFLYVGLRYGVTKTTYDIHTSDDSDQIIEDGIWGGSVPYHVTGEKAALHWGEFIVGVNVKIYRNFHMGWSVRYKQKFSTPKNENALPWYIPGYGKYKDNNLGLTYSLIYKLPFKR